MDFEIPDFLRQYDFISGRFFYLVVRTSGDAQAMTEPIRRVVRSIDPSVPLRSVETLERMVRDTTLPARFRTVALSVFAILSVFVALLGVYGVMAYNVAASVRDIGVRMALGAPAPSVRNAVLRQAMQVVAAGSLIGVVVAGALGPAIRSMLFQVSDRDLLSLASVLLVSGVGALVAAYLPALRASRVDPVEVLRQE